MQYKEDSAYEKALAAFAKISDYKDSDVQMTECVDILYQEALKYKNEKNWEYAIAKFNKIANYKDVEEETKLSKAVLAFDEGDYLSAVQLCNTISECEDGIKLREEAISAWRKRNSAAKTFSVGYSNMAVIRDDGTLWISGRNDENQCDVPEWSDIVSVSVGTWFMAGLKSNGKVVLKQWRDFFDLSEVELWSNIVSIEACSSGIWGLRSNGYVLGGGNYSASFDMAYESYWWGDGDLVAIEAPIGLSADGMVACAEYGYLEWTDIVDIAGDGSAIGLRSDGTLIGVKKGSPASKWTNIIDIAACGGTIVGLKSNGRVVVDDSLGYYEYAELDSHSWNGVIAIDVGIAGIVGLKNDATVVFAERIGVENYISTESLTGRVMVPEEYDNIVEY